MHKILFIVLLLPAACLYASKTIYVDLDSPNDPGTGSYSDPFRRIQDAIDDSGTISGDIIEIRPAVYTGSGNFNIDPLGLDITIRSTDPDDPNIVANTIIDPEETGRGFYIHSGETENCQILGLTIKNAKIAGGYGAGFYCDNSSPTVANCIITDGSARHGGGVYCNSGSLLLRNCTVSNNSSTHDGAGLECWAANLKLENCVIVNNHAEGNGGGIDCWNQQSSTITNCTIAGNSAYSGGGIYCDNSALTTKNNIIWANLSEPNKGPQIALTGISSLLISYSDVQAGYSQIPIGTGGTLDWKEGNIDIDPCFAFFSPADLNTADLHLQSAAGRFNPETQSWVSDSDTSGCIDVGDVNSDYSSEPWPNGKIINLGAYGGTAVAGKNGNIADFDVNGIVNTADLAEFTGRWLENLKCIENLNRNGKVDFADFAIFAENWRWQKY